MHEFVGIRGRPCEECRMPVWYREHMHQALVQMTVPENLEYVEDRRDNRDPTIIGQALFYQQSWQRERGFEMKFSQVADFLPYMSEAQTPLNTQGDRVTGSYQIEDMGPLKGRQFTIYPENGNRSDDAR